MRSILRSPKLLVPAVVLVLAGAAWLAFGYFGVQFLFIDDRVDDAPPVFDAQVAEAASPEDDTSQITTEPIPTESGPAETAPTESTVVPADPDPATTSAAAPVPTTAPSSAPSGAPEVVVEASGTFSGSGRYDVSGVANVLGNGTGQRFLRLEGFESDNGPDLNVYLVNSSAGGYDDFVDLGDLRGNIGDQNYEIPVDVDLDTYDTVVIWCVRFGALFGEAPLV